MRAVDVALAAIAGGYVKGYGPERFGERMADVYDAWYGNPSAAKTLESVEVSPISPRAGRSSSSRSVSILEQYGEPVRSSTLRKHDDRIWGPIGEFWSEVPLGSAVEIWSYRTKAEWEANSGRRWPGTTEIYFVDRSDVITGLGFAPDGVVYESK